MIVIPYLNHPKDKVTVFSRRELLLSDDNFAGVVVGEKFYFVCDDGELISSSIPVNHHNFVEAKHRFTEIRYKDKPNRTTSLLTLLPSDEELFELAGMGIDAAVVCLRIRSRSCEIAKQLYDRSVLLRPRYMRIQHLTFSEANEYFLRIKILDPLIALLERKYFTQTFGSTHFHRNIENSANFLLGDVFKLPYAELGIPTTLKQETYEKYMIKNIFFQNCIFQEVPEFYIEEDRLSYSKKDHLPSTYKNWPDELTKTIDPWTANTRKRLKKMAEEVKIRICASPAITELYSEDNLSQRVNNLSIFCALAFMRDANDKRRIEQMFRAGARHLGHLISIYD